MKTPHRATGRKPAQSPIGMARARFAALLDGHLKKGTRPKAAMGEPWKYAEFAGNVPSARDNDYVSPRSVSNWCKGISLPERIEPILEALFGNSERHAEAREELRTAFLVARAEMKTEPAKSETAGGDWRNGEVSRFTESVVDEDILIEEFIAGIRSRNYCGRAFSLPSYRGLMQETRDRLRPADVTNLLQCTMDSSKSPELRSRCASLISCPRTFPARLQIERQRVLDVLRTYAKLNSSNEGVLPHQVFRAIRACLIKPSQ